MIVPLVTRGSYTALLFDAKWHWVLLFAGGLADTQVSSVFIRTQVESGNLPGAAAVSMVLLLASLLCLAAISLIQRWGSRHERSTGGGLVMPMAGEMPGEADEKGGDDERR